MCVFMFYSTTERCFDNLMLVEPCLYHRRLSSSVWYGKRESLLAVLVRRMENMCAILFYYNFWHLVCAESSFSCSFISWKLVCRYLLDEPITYCLAKKYVIAPKMCANLSGYTFWRLVCAESSVSCSFISWELVWPYLLDEPFTYCLAKKYAISSMGINYLSSKIIL